MTIRRRYPLHPVSALTWPLTIILVAAPHTTDSANASVTGRTGLSKDFGRGVGEVCGTSFGKGAGNGFGRGLVQGLVKGFRKGFSEGFREG